MKFVSGTGDDFGKCSNGSATGYFSSNDQLSALVDDNASGSTESNETTTSSGNEPSSTNEDNGGGDNGDGAMSLQAWGFMSSLLTVAAMAVAGGAFLV